MKFFATSALFLAAGFAAASPVSQDVGLAARDDLSLSDVSSQVDSLKSLVGKDFSGSSTPSTAELGDITDRLNKLIRGLVPLDLDIITDGDLLDLLDVLGGLQGILGGLTSNLPTGSLKARQLSYAPVSKEVRELITTLSKLVSEILTTVYTAIGSTAAKEDPETQQKLISQASGVAGGLGGLFSLLGGLGDIGSLSSLIPIAN